MSVYGDTIDVSTWVLSFWPWTISMHVSPTSNCHYLPLFASGLSLVPGSCSVHIHGRLQCQGIQNQWLMGVNGFMHQLPLSSEFPSRIKFQLLTVQICSIMHLLLAFISSCLTSPCPTSISWDHLPNPTWSFLGFENKEQWVSLRWVWSLVHCLFSLN